VFAGDETALPAIASLLELLPPSQGFLAFVEVADPVEEQDIPGVRWVHRSAGEDLVTVVTRTGVPSPVWVWLGGEASAVRALRRHFVALGMSKKEIGRAHV